jgi:hypothetical protein
LPLPLNRLDVVRACHVTRVGQGSGVSGQANEFVRLGGSAFFRCLPGLQRTGGIVADC